MGIVIFNESFDDRASIMQTNKKVLVKQMIDVNFDFTSDSPGYWHNFWNRNNGLGAGGSDPDNVSPTLKQYHKILWSKPLPNGDFMDLKAGNGSNYLTWNNFRFGSDSIIVSFRYQKYKHVIDNVMNQVKDYKSYYESFLRKAYTIGGMIIFPKHPSSMNQMKGTNRYISDRWDLTLECIRRYYSGQTSPLYSTIVSDKAFYDLFVDFKGYIDFFLLQDAVTDDYSQVKIWCGNADFEKNALPSNVEDYLTFIENELVFLDKRNARIKEYCDDLE